MTKLFNGTSSDSVIQSDINQIIGEAFKNKFDHTHMALDKLYSKTSFAPSDTVFDNIRCQCATHANVEIKISPGNLINSANGNKRLTMTVFIDDGTTSIDSIVVFETAAYGNTWVPFFPIYGGCNTYANALNLLRSITGNITSFNFSPC
ncbi:hypothetical protein [Novacetimonas hansenii]|uniref:hypothetical protein n=1 Tax=Novacetimonas hansenii TaxID=436 RepID=UPI00117AF1A3|nr:hypothetical protein [Novacetimonas hansenii]